MRPARHSPLLKHQRRLQPNRPTSEIDRDREPENKPPNWVRLVGWIAGGLVGLISSPLVTLAVCVILSLIATGGSIISSDIILSFFPTMFCIFGPLSVLIGSTFGPGMILAIETGIDRFADWLRK